jgi:glycosyltransferase involved in cell wall biosynthesis
MARFHDVTVLTQAKNQAAIEKGLRELGNKRPELCFVYHALSPTAQRLRQHYAGFKIHYILWQKSARDIVSRLHQEQPFDLMHHVTFAGYRYPTAIWGHGVRTIWGPVGGIESVPLRLLPWSHPVSFTQELTRNAHNLIQATPFNVLPQRMRITSLMLATTREMQQAFAKRGFEAELMPTIGLNTADMPHQPHQQPNGPLKLLFAGNIITLKGVDLALAALKQSGCDASFTLVGDGGYLGAAERLSRKLGLSSRVKFVQRLPHEQLLALYPEYDVFVFPSLHDTGGYAVIEAMSNELPVVCLDCGGPAVAVADGCGIRIPLGSRARVIAGLAAALKRYDQNRQELLEHGRRARRHVLESYDWARKGEQMNRCYEAAMNCPSLPRAARLKTFAGPLGWTTLLRQLVSLRGVLTGTLGLCLIGALPFVGLSFLKGRAKEIVRDTLPGLTYAGEANASLSQSFNRCLLSVLSDDSSERDRLRKEVQEYSARTTDCLEAYRGQIFSPEEQHLYKEMIQLRQGYFAVRNELFTEEDAGNRQRVLALCSQRLLPAFEQYKAAGDRLFAFNVQQGQYRGELIMRACSLTQIILSCVAGCIFIGGLLVGMFR